MQQHLLARLLHAPQDLDYVERFQALQEVNLRIRKGGPSADLLLRKSVLEMEVGNFVAGLGSAKDAATLEQDNAEAHYQEARAYVFLALAKAQGIALGPSLRTLPGESATALLMKSREAFSHVMALNGGDEEASRELAAVAELLEGCDDETGLLSELREAGI